MKITYDKKKLREIIDSICNLTGLSMCVMDTGFNTLYTREKKEDAFCHKIQKTPEGKEKCRCSDVKMLEECARTKAPVSHVCHAGLIDTVVPIIKNGIVVGFIIIGRVRQTMECPNALFKNDYKKLTYLSKKQLSSLVDLLSHILFENAVQIEYNDFISRATEYIEQNLDKKLSVDILCRELFVSKNYLYESFHSFYGCTVNEYITNRKIDAAKVMLCENGVTALLVAKSLGYDNYSYFCKLFKKKVGCSPTSQRSNINDIQ